MGKAIRYCIVPTYRCNAKCQHCNRLLGAVPWPDSDMTVEDVKLGWKRIQERSVAVQKVRVSGGEPLLHPDFVELMEAINATWNRRYTRQRRTCVFTNGSLPLPPRREWRYNLSGTGPDKTESLKPPMISPSDLGMPFNRRPGGFCQRQFGCGRLFDAHGFSFCFLAGPVGRMLGIDTYHAYPALDMEEEICGHCPFAVGVRGAFALFRAAASGELEYPTKTYREAIERWKVGGGIKLKKFQERKDG